VRRGFRDSYGGVLDPVNFRIGLERQCAMADIMARRTGKRNSASCRSRKHLLPHVTGNPLGGTGIMMPREENGGFTAIILFGLIRGFWVWFLWPKEILRLQQESSATLSTDRLPPIISSKYD